MTEKTERARNTPKGNEVKISDHITGGEYANIMQVMHTKEEFRLMFAHVFEPTGKVVSKITTTPAHFKRMVHALQENLNRFEKEHGKIEDVSDASGQKIGFE